MIQVNALGDACPIPVVKTKNAIKELGGSGVVETLVDNEIAVQNLTKMANQKGYKVSSKKLSDRQYQVTMEIGENAADKQTAPTKAESETCIPDARENTVVVIASATMGEGDPELGRASDEGVHLCADTAGYPAERPCSFTMEAPPSPARGPRLWRI